MDSFFQLDPKSVLDAVEKTGLITTGEFVQLNSYENRVFDVKLETFSPHYSENSQVIAKFYRPGRWSRETILEEHEFLYDLSEEQIAVAAPLNFYGDSLIDANGMWMALFPKIRGRLLQELMPDDLFTVGVLLARLHNVGSRKYATHRHNLDASYFGGWPTLDELQSWIAPELRQRYSAAAETILFEIESQINPDEFIRIHGDCHRGNIIHDGKGLCLVDFDDFCNGPVVQDFWMLMSGDEDFADAEKSKIVEGYEQIREFPDHQWNWVPLLRGLRVLSYAGWIAKRWSDPSFPRIFPDFNTYKYWAEETEALERIAWQI